MAIGLYVTTINTHATTNNNRDIFLPNSQTRSFIYGLGSGLLLGGMQRATTMAIVNRYSNCPCIKPFSPGDKNPNDIQTSSERYSSENAYFYGTNTTAFTFGVASNEMLDKGFRTFGSEFWSNLDPDTKKQVLQKGYNFGKFLLSGTIALTAFYSDSGKCNESEQHLANLFLFNEIGSMTGAAFRITDDGSFGLSWKKDITHWFTGNADSNENSNS